MPRPLSQLLRAHIQDGAGSPRIITLHDYNQRGGDGKDYAIAAGPDARIIGLESFKGVYVGRDIVGYTWFVGPMERPSPLFFGDALAEIERFLWDEIDRQGGDRAELPFLLGIGQGAIMALAAAAAVPDLLSGVIAVNATLPVVPGWDPPLAPLAALPVLVVDGPNADSAPTGVLAGPALEDRFQGWGAAVTRQPAMGDGIPGESMRTWLAAQPVRYRQA